MKANVSIIRAISGYPPAIAVLSAMFCLAAYGGFRTISNPGASRGPQDALASGASEHGRTLFLRSCAHCHGDDAHGAGSDEDGPDLYNLRISNARIAVVIRKGIQDEMPSFAKKHPRQDIADLTAYLRSLR